MVCLRGVELTDLDALFAIDRICFRPGIAYSRADLRYFLSHPRSISILAEDDAAKTILGFVIAQSFLEKGGRVGHFITIDVEPGRRRTGLGRMLMDAMLERLKSAGIATVRLEVAADNAGAQAFYLGLGFARTGRIPGFYMGTLDAFSMEKLLDPGCGPHEALVRSNRGGKSRAIPRS
jgi:ribosomal-protein-alanine N-acetyltransferase